MFVAVSHPEGWQSGGYSLTAPASRDAFVLSVP
jgi:hypothetical protein